MKSQNELEIVGFVRVGGRGNEMPHQRDWIYSETGICCGLTATMYKDPPRVLIRRRNNERHNTSRTS